MGQNVFHNKMKNRKIDDCGVSSRLFVIVYFPVSWSRVTKDHVVTVAMLNNVLITNLVG